jgi:purine-binding chemotaxis protein CheW
MHHSGGDWGRSGRGSWPGSAGKTGLTRVRSQVMRTNTQAAQRWPAAAQQTPAQETSFAPSLNSDECAQLITFSIGGQQYAIDILEVLEVRSLSQVAFAAGSHSRFPAFMLHGETVPILDLRSAGPAALTPMHVVIVVQNRWGALGLLADQMPDMITADLASLHAEPRLLRLRGLDVPAGDLTIAGKLITLIDPSDLRVSTGVHERPVLRATR